MKTKPAEMTSGMLEQNQRIRENLEDWDGQSYEELEACFEDRDPLEFL